jgi:hypothetical protein
MHGPVSKDAVSKDVAAPESRGAVQFFFLDRSFRSIR